MIEKTFGELIKKLREDRNLTLREVAEYLSIDTSLLSKIENNNRTPSKRLVIKFAQYFHVSVRKLKIAVLSDKIVYEAMEEYNIANDIIKVAEKKIKYLNKNYHK